MSSPEERPMTTVFVSGHRTRILSVVLGLFALGVLLNAIVGSVVFAVTRAVWRQSDEVGQAAYVGELTVMLSLPYHCDFEAGGQCMVVEPRDAGDDDFDWTRHTAATATRHTGPQAAAAGQHYVYIEASSPRETGDKARIESRVLGHTGSACLRFAYHMYGAAIGKLTVYTISGINMKPVRTIDENNGHVWTVGEETLSLTQNDRIGFIAHCGKDIQGDIAIDEISVTDGKCRGDVNTGLHGDCGRLDLVFLVDNSGSITDNGNQYPSMKRFMARVIDRLDVRPDGVRVGVLRFADRARLEFHLDGFQSAAEVVKAIDAMSNSGGNTNTSAGLLTLRTEMFTERHGDRPDVGNAVVIITDGHSTYSKERTLPEARLARQAGIMLIVVGVTHEVNQTELRLMSSVPDYRYYVQSTDSRQVLDIVNEAMDHACHGDKSEPRAGDLPHQCGFEADVCDTQQPDWTAWTRRSVSSDDCEQPSANGGGYMTVGVADMQRYNGTATLFSGKLRWAGASCISFDWAISGGRRNRLTVGLTDRTGALRTVYGSDVASWRTETVNARVVYGHRVTFKAVGAGSSLGQFSFDNLKLLYGRC